MKYPKIAEKGKIGSIETKNRLVMTAMGVGVGSPSGEATDAFIRFYEERAKGGAGLIITEITRVNDIHGAGEYDQLSLACDDTIESFQPKSGEAAGTLSQACANASRQCGRRTPKRVAARSQSSTE